MHHGGFASKVTLRSGFRVKITTLGAKRTLRAKPLTNF